MAYNSFWLHALYTLFLLQEPHTHLVHATEHSTTEIGLAHAQWCHMPFPGSHSYPALAWSNLTIAEGTANSINTNFKPQLKVVPTHFLLDPPNAPGHFKAIPHKEKYKGGNDYSRKR